MAFLGQTGLAHLWAHIVARLGEKVDKTDGMGLSTNDYTTTEKNKLAGIAEGATKTIVDSALSSTSANPVQNKVVNSAISNLNTLVGDTSVSSQISNAIVNKLDKTATAADSSKLGGVAASSYALKTDTAPNSTKLNGQAASYYATASALSSLTNRVAALEAIPNANGVSY